MSTLHQLQVDVERRMRGGEAFTSVECAVRSSALRETEKAALWLYAWSFVDAHLQRRDALARLAGVLEEAGEVGEDPLPQETAVFARAAPRSIAVLPLRDVPAG